MNVHKLSWSSQEYVVFFPLPYLLRLLLLRRLTLLWHYDAFQVLTRWAVDIMSVFCSLNYALSIEAALPVPHDMHCFICFVLMTGIRSVRMHGWHVVFCGCDLFKCAKECWKCAFVVCCAESEQTYIWCIPKWCLIHLIYFFLCVQNCYTQTDLPIVKLFCRAPFPKLNGNAWCLWIAGHSIVHFCSLALSLNYSLITLTHSLTHGHLLTQSLTHSLSRCQSVYRGWKKAMSRVK